MSSRFSFSPPRLPPAFLSRPVVHEDAIPVFNQDPSWVRFNELRHARRLAELESLHTAELPLLHDLADIGLEFASIWNLVHARRRYPEAIPVLVRHLDAAYPPYIQEGIARALASAESRGLAGAALLRALRVAPTDDSAYIELRIALAQALALAASPPERDGLRRVLADPAQLLVHPILERALQSTAPRIPGRLAA